MRVMAMQLRQHPVQGWCAEDRARAIAVSVHGDEGSGKRGQAVLLISISSLAIHGDSMYTKFPFVVSCLT